MANSSYLDTVLVMDVISRLEPKSVLDVGAGFGRWGFLCRCHLGPGESLQTTPDQDLCIEAIEAFEPNINPAYEAVYNKTHVGDAREIVPTLGEYDVVLSSHMIEHMTKDEGRELIREMKARSRMALIVALPFHDPIRGPLRGNVYEAHHSVWTQDDFRGQDVYLRTIPFVNNTQLAVAVYPVSAEARWTVRTLRNPLRRLVIARLPRFARWVSWAMGRRRTPASN